MPANDTNTAQESVDSIVEPVLKENFIHAFFTTPIIGSNYWEGKEAIKRLIDESRINNDYIVMLVFATLLTTFGLLLDNTAVVIGGMLMAPLLSSILSLGLAFVTINLSSIVRSVWSVLRSLLTVLFVSYSAAAIFGVPDINTTEILVRTIPTWFYVHVAIISGLAATYTWAKPKLSATLPGVAIAVALLPPLCVVGIAMSVGDSIIVTDATVMFLVNFLGIIISSIVIFTLLGFKRFKYVEHQEIHLEKNLKQNQKIKSPLDTIAVKTIVTKE